MLIDVVKVKVVSDYTLYLQFEDGEEGEIDISTIVPFEGVFAKLEDIEYFATVRLNKELGTIIWDNGADLAPSYLYSVIKL
jgi:Protein of unknown function (DUF2442)